MKLEHLDAHDELLCPHCGGEYLHHGKVHVHNRDREDGDTTKITVSGLKSKRRTTGGGGNPSGRRDGVVIDFWCEHCTAKPQLCIAQHKGLTYIGWRNTDAR